MVSEADVTLICSQQRLVDLLPPHSAPLLCLDTEQAAIAVQPSHNPQSCALSANLAYLVYTSGTTGTPKGILIEHRSLVNAIYAFIFHHRMSERDRLLQFASLSFDVAAEEFFAAWLCGGCAVMWPEQVIGSHEEFRHWLEQQRVTVVNLPASFWAEWLGALAEAGDAPPRS
jgi:non-ribosomal peptide synthetase component F